MTTWTSRKPQARWWPTSVSARSMMLKWQPRRMVLLSAMTTTIPTTRTAWPSQLSLLVRRLRSPSLLPTNTGANAFLNAWADWNEDGDVADANEALTSVSPTTQITVATSATVNRTFTFNFTVPSTARGTVPVRVRLTSVTTPGADGLDGNGEVEDHVVTLATNCASQLAIYNAIISNNLSTPSDIQGRSVIKTIIGADSFSTGHLVSGASTIASAVQTTVASGGPINVVNGSFYIPSVGALNGRTINFPGGGSLVHSPAFDFASVFSGITSESTTYAAMPTNSHHHDPDLASGDLPHCG